MTDAQLYTTILDVLLQSGDWITFDELERALPWDATDEKRFSELRRARLRGAVARAIYADHIERTKTGQAKYRIKQDFAEMVDLFSGAET